jgi:pyridoxamine 5'-phosphate oxidase
MKIDELRNEYKKARLDEASAAASPFVQFRTWFDEALAAEVREPNAMTLATVREDGRPAARIVLLKGMEDERFLFYTNYDSEKGQELSRTPYAAMVFFWEPLERQVRIEGEVLRVDARVSDAYFETRPRQSQLGAWASAQSSMVDSRDELERRFAEVTRRFDGAPVPRPANWGGYAVVPSMFEFWQGRPGRLHDRLRYVRTSRGFERERLCP